MEKIVVGLMMILKLGMAFAQEEPFARCDLKAPLYEEKYEFFGKPHSNSALVAGIRSNGTYPFRAIAQTAVFGNQLEYQRISFLRGEIPTEIIFVRGGKNKVREGTLYQNGVVTEVSCQELYDYFCNCFAGHCTEGCYGK